MKIITQEQAKKLNLKKYFTNVCCSSGHVAERVAATGYCVECVKISSKRYRQSQKGKVAISRYTKSDKGKRTHKQFMDTDKGKLVHKNNNVRYGDTENGYQKQREIDARYKKNNPGKVNAGNALRHVNKIKACPVWAKLDKIRELYIKASTMSKTLNEKYEVDHIIPLNGKTVCGLHCEQNLQILTKQENAIKHNKLLENEFVS